MNQPMNAQTKRQLDIARSKARDELVLLAMNLSEALVSQQDNFYGNLPISLATVVETQQDDSENYSDIGHPKGRGRDRGGARGQKARNREGGGGGGGGGGRGRTRQEARQAAAAATTELLDEGTLAWFKGIKAPPAAQDLPPTTAVTAEDQNTKTDADRMTGVAACTSVVPLDVTTIEPTMATTNLDRASVSTATEIKVQQQNEENKPEKMLNPDQVDCLLLALAYLPAQESQAVRSRLYHLLNAPSTKTSGQT